MQLGNNILLIPRSIIYKLSSKKEIIFGVPRSILFGLSNYFLIILKITFCNILLLYFLLCP